ncbi:MAG: hypothetical protein WCD43_06905 [Candidatus Acidiferrales bacterium]
MALWMALASLLLSMLAIIVAVCYGPVAAVKMQRKLDEEREAKKLEREMLKNSIPDKNRSGPPVLPRL